MREEIKKLNMYAANVFSTILAQNSNAIAAPNRDRFITKSFEIARGMMNLDNPQPSVDHGEHISDEVAEAFAKKDMLLKTLLAGIFGSDMDAVAMSLHHDDSELVDEAIAVVAGLRDDSKLLDEETSRANKLESELSGILHEFYDDREDCKDNLPDDFIKKSQLEAAKIGSATVSSFSLNGKKVDEDNATSNNILRAAASALVKRSIDDLGIYEVDPRYCGGALSDTAGAGHIDTDKLAAAIKKASENGDYPTINGSEREWQEFVKQFVLRADKHFG